MPEYTFKCRKCSHKTSLFCSFTEYDAKKIKVKCSSCKSKKVDRDFETDNIGGFVSIPLSDCKTIGEYADKQSSKYTRTQREDMIEQFKTKKSGGMKKLPTGMSRINKASKKKGK
tara:strand:+ start:371 stop:715 length:345 start_codon:yes stop_codon:yes gene_type:complete